MSGPGPLRLGGLVPLSMSDYPDQLSAVVFCQGCPWRCGYCHNPHLLPSRTLSEIPWSAVMGFLGQRRGLLDAVVFSGGEPTGQAALPAAIREVKALGYRIGLHTAGIYPRRLAAVLPLLDWVGMDVKAPFGDYERITGVAGSGAHALASARLLVNSGCAYEFRTTLHPSLGADDLTRLADELVTLGARRYVFQECRREGNREAGYASRMPAAGVDSHFMAEIAERFEAFTFRGDIAAP